MDTNTSETLSSAADPGTEPEQLLHFAHHPDPAVRRLVAGNPSTPLEGLLALALEFGDEVGANAALVLHRMASVDLVSHVPGSWRDAWSRSPRVAPWLAEQLAHFEPESHVRAQLARNPRCPLPVLAHLVSDAAFDVRVAVAKNPRCPSDTLALLARDPSEYVRRAVASKPITPLALLPPLSADPSSSVRSAVASNPRCPVEQLEYLATDPDSSVRAAVASHPRCPPTLLRQLADGTGSPVRAAPPRPRSPVELPPLPAGSDDALVQGTVARRPDCPPGLLAWLVDHGQREARLSAVSHPACPVATLHAVAAHPDPAFRHAVDRNPSCPPDLKERLQHDPELARFRDRQRQPPPPIREPWGKR